MSRTFWMVVGAVGGVAAYRKGTRAAARAKELGPMGSAQVAATATSKLAGRTATGLGRLQDMKARRDGRMVTGSIQADSAGSGGVGSSGVQPPPVGWLRAPAPDRPIPTARGSRAGHSSATEPSAPGDGGR